MFTTLVLNFSSIWGFGVILALFAYSSMGIWIYISSSLSTRRAIGLMFKSNWFDWVLPAISLGHTAGNECTWVCGCWNVRTWMYFCIAWKHCGKHSLSIRFVDVPRNKMYNFTRKTKCEVVHTITFVYVTGQTTCQENTKSQASLIRSFHFF